MERLHKFMAHCGIASRRQAEDFIKAGRVSVNDEIITELGVKIDPEHDIVAVDGQILKPEKKVCYLLHKPRGYATTVDDDLGRKTVLDLLPEVKERIYPAGRLDFDSEGLIVLTNDGDAAYFLTHPSCGVRKVYEATVEGEVDDSTIATLLEKGVYLGAIRIKPIMAKIVKRQNDSTIVRVIVAEGVNREVRRLFAALGHEVKRLVRLEVGPFRIDGIGRGQYRLATPQEIAALHESMKLVGQHNSTTTSHKHSPKTQKKYGKSTSTPRTGKPDPALYGKGGRVRRAPLILDKKKNHQKVAGVPDSQYEKGYGDKEAVFERKKSQSPLRPYERPQKGMKDVSYETLGEVSRHPEKRYNGNPHRNDFGKTSDYRSQNKRNDRRTFQHASDKGFSRPNHYHKRERNNDYKNDMDDASVVSRSFHKTSNYRKYKEQETSHGDLEGRFSRFQRPPSRVSNRNAQHRNDQEKKTILPEGNKRRHQMKRDEAKPNHQRFGDFGNDFRSPNRQHSERNKAMASNLKPKVTAKMNKKGKHGRPKPSRHPLDR